MKAYDSYKNSSIDWVGLVPKHWNVSKYKFAINILSGFPFKSELFSKEKGIPLMRIRDISSGTIETFYDGDYSEDYIVKMDDLVVGMDGDFNIRWWNNVNALLNQRCCVIKSNKGISNLRFLYYIIPNDLKIINDLAYFTTVKHLSSNDLYNRELALPPIEEQTQIAAFLDYKTNLIDATIEKKKRLIELLKEKRQAVINEAVTKGLNPNAKMKASGVEWLGEIPEHWICLPFRRICSLQQGLQIPINERFYEEIENSYEYITTKSIHNPNDFKQYILNPNSSVICNENDVLMGRTGNTGEVVTNVKGVFHNNFFKIDFDRTKFNKDFFVNYLNFTGLQKTILLVAGTTTIPDINHGAFLELNATLPPLIEQLEIVNFINNKTRQIDTLVKKSEKLIEKLQEYRQSLISEAVTGKIDVRDWQNPQNN